MALSQRKRKILRMLGAICVALILLVVAQPLWLPWVLRPLCARWGLNYANYERAGYGQFILRGVTFSSVAARFQAGQVRALLPTVWLWHRYVDPEPVTYVEVQDWKIEIMERKGTSQGSRISLYTNVAEFGSIVAKAGSWLPKAFLTNGTIALPTQLPNWVSAARPFLSASFESLIASAPTRSTNQMLGAILKPQTEPSSLMLRLPTAAWVKRKFFAEVEFPGSKRRAKLDAQLGVAAYEVAFHAEPFHSTTVLSENTAGLRLQSTTFWLSNRIDASAQFGRRGSLPERALVEADSFKIPAELLGLENFQEVAGSLSFQWQSNQFALRVSASSRPQAPTNSSAIDVEIHSHGNTESAYVETARISCPWLTAELSPGTEIKFASPFLREEAVFKMTADLSQQPWFAAEGKLDGQVKVRPAQNKFPALSFAFSGMAISVSNLHTKTLVLNGEFGWPWLDITHLNLVFPNGSTASLNAELEVEKKIVRGGHLRIEDVSSGQFLPAGYSFDHGSLDVSFSGPAQSLVHTGQLSARDFTIASLRPLEVQAEWQGEGLNLKQSRILASRGRSSLEFGGSLATSNNETKVVVQTLTLRQNRQSVMEIAKPWPIALRRAVIQANGLPGPWRLQLESLQWRAPNRELALESKLDGSHSGKLVITARSLDVSWLEDFLPLSWSEVQIDELNLQADWNNGPLNLVVGLSASTTRHGFPLSAKASFSADGKGVSLHSLAISSRTQPVFRAKGFLPLTLTPGHPEHWLNFLAAPPIQLDVATQPQSIFWDEIAASTGVTLVDPQLDANVSGTWELPQGHVEVRVEQIKWRENPPAISGLVKRPGGGPALSSPQSKPLGGTNISLEDMHLTVELDRELARIKNLSVLLQGQPITMAGEMPLGKSFWMGVERGKVWPDWEKSTARLKMENAPLAAFVPLLPKVLGLQGKLNLDLSLLPGGKVDGELKVAGGSTKPLAQFGIFRDLNLNLKFSERAISLQSVSASIGGAPLRASGHVDLHGTEWLKRDLPPFQITVQGENLPLARDPGFILRSDVNITISKGQTGPAMVTGLAQLRDSFYLRDLKDLLPVGTASPSERPPYFSIEAEPLADWRLNLSLKGNRFLKVNSPLFRGLLSADLKLIGTLKDPIAQGELKIESGVAQFPFANLDVKQGFVTLTSENPYRPQLLVNAASRNAGYDVKMELTGPADQPSVQFSSTPPLNSDQIALMLTAGEMPRNEFMSSPGQRAGRVALFVGKNLLSQFGVGEQSGRLTIRTGENISETGNPTYDVEYKLNKRWSLVGERDQFNAFNFGFRWKIYSK